jgi:hypothetical protein
VRRACQEARTQAWVLRVASSLENRPRYTPTACSETFLFPERDDERREPIAAAAHSLHETRGSRLRGDPKLTMTALHNARPQWLANRHAAPDGAVLRAYRWPSDIGEEDLPERLLALNLERAEEEEGMD